MNHSPKSSFLSELVQRGYVEQCTDFEKLDEAFATDKITAYVGLDCTAKSLHVGNLMQLMILRQLLKHGHKAILLLGNATTEIGDPSGKDKSRPILEKDNIVANCQSIKAGIERFLTGNTQNAAELTVVYNGDWLHQLGYLEFISKYGRCFTVNRMLRFESIKSRLDRQESLTFLEMNYMILQAYDFVELYKRHNCTVQFGGSEQWGNIVSGIDLGRRITQAELLGFTTPLITTSDGKKMGKSEKGAVWINDDLMSAYDYWQFWRNTSDQDVTRFLKLYTDLELNEIDRLSVLKGEDINAVKVLLANEATALCHGSEAAKIARITAEKTFEQGMHGEALPVYRAALNTSGIKICDLLYLSGLATSRKNARVLIKGGGVYINNEQIHDETAVLNHSDFNPNIKISVGKKRHIVVEPYTD